MCAHIDTLMRSWMQLHFTEQQVSAAWEEALKLQV